MRLADGGAPVTVKHRAVKQSEPPFTMHNNWLYILKDGPFCGSFPEYASFLLDEGIKS
jgi:hypothetical protein